MPIGYIQGHLLLNTPMIKSKKSRNISVATDKGPSSKLALNEGGSKGNIES